MRFIIITSCGNSIALAQDVARRLKVAYSPLTISAFPDGDVYLRFKAKLQGETLVIVHSFQPEPNMSLFNVIFAAETAKDLGAKKVILVAPYLAFMRQDKRFHPGEAVSSKIMAKLLSGSVDQLITFDTHLHRYHSLKEVFCIPARNLTANMLLAAYIKKKFRNLVIIGPDEESYQWAEEIAKVVQCPVTCFKKTRYSSRKVAVKMVKTIPLKGKNVVIVDDVISTGHTVVEAAKEAYHLGAKRVDAVAVHGLFAETAMTKLKKAKIKTITTTNTIKHKTNKIDVADLIGKALS